MSASLLGFAVDLHRRFGEDRLPELRGRSTDEAADGQSTTLTESAPLFLLCCTLGDLVPVLAIVEDTSRGGYAHLPLEPMSETAPGSNADSRDIATEDTGDTRYRPVSASIRSTLGLLFSIAGFPSLFRGFGCFLALNMANITIQITIGAIPSVPTFVADVLPPLLTVPVHVAWTRIVVSAPSSRPFWHRLPEFAKAFRATALPAAIFLAASAISRRAPFFISHLVGVTTPKSPFTFELTPRITWDMNDLIKMVFLMATCLVFIAVLVTPSHAVLTRVEASIIPDEDRTIIAFDKTFAMKSSEQGFLHVRDAWASLKSEV
ncbi:hypothetical protein PG993_009679 [Apiospora rasikravindrae]|uniref:Uncharacterized protein n=1 Tax=Apiospora rasikravindrae TaxID=990691 RepID=A0ABR1SLV3_9PEZI